MRKNITTYKQTIIKYIPQLRRYAYALCGDSETADELILHCLQCANGLSHLLKPQIDVKIWLLTMLHNMSHEFLNGSTEVTDYESMMTEIMLIPFEDSELEVDVSLALYKLPLDQREIVLLVDLEKLNYEEVCEIVNLPVGAMAARLNDARRLMCTVLIKGDVPPQQVVQ